MNNVDTKKSRFIALLPEIYRKRIIENWDYKHIAEWLRDEHGLDFFSPKNPESYNLFNVYLKNYGGDLKGTYKAYHEKRIKDLDASFLSPIPDHRTPAYSKKARQQTAPTSDNALTPVNVQATQTGDADNSSKEEGKSGGQYLPFSDRLGLAQLNKRKIPDNPLEGYQRKI
jgi:hypothetical protein